MFCDYIFLYVSEHKYHNHHKSTKALTYVRSIPLKKFQEGLRCVLAMRSGILNFKLRFLLRFLLVAMEKIYILLKKPIIKYIYIC